MLMQTLETFSWYSDNENILVKMLPKNRAALLDERKTYQQVQLFQMQPVQFQNRTYQDLLKKLTKLIFRTF
jgi:hypothetical protein